MSKLPEDYKRIVAMGIDKSANLSDLNDLTDRGRKGLKPLKPWTANKTVGTIKLIRDFNVKDEESLLNLFQKYSKIPIEVLVDQVHAYQQTFFGFFKYDKKVIFKYAYCCIIINSLKGFSTENLFDKWASRKGAIVTSAPAFLDQKFHVDRLQKDSNGKLISFISIKPKSFSIQPLQYIDVFAGLQVLYEISGIPWKIFYKNGDNFTRLVIDDFTDKESEYIMGLTGFYSKEEVSELKSKIDSFLD